MQFNLLIKSNIQLLDIDLTVFLIESQSNLNHLYYIHVLQLLNSRQDVRKVFTHYRLLSVFKHPDTAAVQEEISLIPIERKHYVPQFHRLIQAKLLS